MGERRGPNAGGKIQRINPPRFPQVRIHIQLTSILKVAVVDAAETSRLFVAGLLLVCSFWESKCLKSARSGSVPAIKMVSQPCRFTICLSSTLFKLLHERVLEHLK